MDVTLTGATFEKKEQIFIFDEKTRTITGVVPLRRSTFDSAISVTFPDEIDGVEVEGIQGTSPYSNFYNSGSNMNIETIHLPKNLKTIGNYAFGTCLSLTSMLIPQSVTSIGQGAFTNCLALTVTIKQSDPSKITLHKDVF